MIVAPKRLFTLLFYPASTGNSSDRKPLLHLGKERLIGGVAYVCRS